MKILFLVDWHVHRLDVDSEAIQAPEKVVIAKPYWFFKHLPQPGIEIDVLDFCNIIPLFHFFERRILHFYITQSLFAYIKRKKYDFIISHSARSGLFLAFLRSFLKELSPKHVVIDIGSFNGGRDNSIELLLIRKASESISGIITHSSIQAEFYNKYMAHIPYRFIHFGVDMDYFKPMNFAQEEYVLSFGSHMRDYPTLIDAWKLIVPDKIRLKIIGIDRIQGVDRLPDNVDLISWVPILSLKEKIAKARFIILPLPCYNYSYGQMSFLQSMALKKSCIVTNTPSTRDYLTNEKDALFVKPYDKQDMAEKINLLLNNSNINNTIAINARQSIENKYNEKIMAKKLFEFISELL